GARAQTAGTSVVPFVGDFRAADREWAQNLGLGDRLELHSYLPRRQVLELQRDSEALLLLIPESGGRGRGVLSGKVFEYLAAERPILAVVPPDGAAAALLRETGAGVGGAPDDVGGAGRGRRSGRRGGEARGARRTGGELPRRHAERRHALGRMARAALPPVA